MGNKHKLITDRLFTPLIPIKSGSDLAKEAFEKEKGWRRYESWMDVYDVVHYAVVQSPLLKVMYAE